MKENVLEHHGVLGQKWGVLRSKSALYKAGLKERVRKRSSEKNQNESKTDSSSKTSKKTTNPKKMSDADLNKAIQRLQLEKQYRDLSKSQISEGKKIVADIVRSSAKNIGTQAVTYLFGTAVNKAFKKTFNEDIVNPKKGQRDKK